MYERRSKIKFLVGECKREERKAEARHTLTHTYIHKRKNEQYPH
jgi:hypothetical protein